MSAPAARSVDIVNRGQGKGHMPIVVIGDVMLDLFEEGQVERISPEAPVPVLHNPRGYDVLGGAANAARNIHSLGRPAAIVGLVGEDPAGQRCRQLLTDAGITDGMIDVPGWSTIVKQRFLAGGQQILRVDREDDLPDESASLLIEHARSHLSDASAVVFSDYDKGVTTDDLVKSVMHHAHDAGIPVIVDSKRPDPSIFRGCAVLTPNHKEATSMTGLRDPALAAARIAEITESAVVVTLGPDGMLLFHAGRTEHIRSRVREVADVTGAGDSVTAALAVAIAEGASLLEAAEFATRVAAVAVEHSGTYAVNRDDVHDETPDPA